MKQFRNILLKETHLFSNWKKLSKAKRERSLHEAELLLITMKRIIKHKPALRKVFFRVLIQDLSSLVKAFGLKESA